MMPTEASWLGVPGTLVFALVLIGAIAAFAYTASRRWQLLTIGGPEDVRWDRPVERLKGLFELGIFQKKMWWDGYAGLYHMLIFSGFVVLSVRTLSLVFEGLFPKAGMPFLPAGAWQAYLLLKDVVLVTTLVGVVLALGRRYVFRKERLDPSFDAGLILVLIGFLMATDLLAGAAKFALAPEHASAWEPFTAGLSGLLAGAAPATLQAVFSWCWWLHLVAILVFLNYLPFAKHFHVITALPNIFLRKLDAPGRLPTVDIEKAAEAEKFGVAKVEDLTWKQRLDLFTCTECGRCREVCPTHLTGKPLTPKGFLKDVRTALYTVADDLVDTAEGRADVAAQARLEERKPLIGGWVDEETIWACTTCRYCESACPVTITYTDKIVEMRRHLVLEKSEFPKEAQTAFNGMERQGNPWNLPSADRDAWTGELDFEVPVLGAMDESERAQVEVLFWVGCAGSYEDRGKKVSRALARLLHEGGVKFAILGAEETCNGDSARRLGNEYLFQTLAQQNVETMNGYGVKRIVTNCPHCFNTLKNEYPDFGGTFEVIHGTELVALLLAEGRLQLTESVAKSISFHDACYLGRHNDVYDAPREVLAAIPGLTLTELPRTGKNGLCCGAGGGRMWLDEKIGTRINQLRYEEIESAGTDLVGVSCPFCMVMLGNAQTEMSGKTQPFDVLELAAQALPAHPGAGTS
ncbi:MAG: (Fe-S)-binding protein [Thermoanaerobaculia bacterium]|jgi:Fe-S oxidoreductase/nitrate reductase gamma subunit|nr:(Fe-S)-binding protein [Thermoanaerobaculia bacterium]